MRLRLTIIAAAALLGSFGAAGAMNGLWASPDARSHSLDGFKLALGMPYGSTGTTHKMQVRASNALEPLDQSGQQAQASNKARHKTLVAHLFEEPLVQSTPRMVMAQAASSAAVFSSIAPPAPQAPPEPAQAVEAPAAPSPPAAPAMADLEPAPNAPGTMANMIAQAHADARKSTRLALEAAAAAGAAEQARTSARVQVHVIAPEIVTPMHYEGLEQELDQAVRRLEITQTLAARIQEGDFSFVVSSDGGTKTCVLGQTEGVCGLISAQDVARVRSEVVAQVRLAQVAVRKSQLKLARARLTDG